MTILAYIGLLVGSFFNEVKATILKINKDSLSNDKLLFLIFFSILIGISLLSFLIPFKWHFTFFAVVLGIINILGVILTYHYSLIGMQKADRSTMNFLIIMLMPLGLLILDYFLGFHLTNWQLIGFAYMLIIMALFNLFSNKGKINLKGIKPVFIFIGINIIDTEVFKYLITYYHSLTGQMLITTTFVTLFRGVIILKKSKKEGFINKFKEFDFMLKGKNIFLGFVSMLGGVLTAIVYTILPASLISILNNSLRLLWSILSGIFVFKEDHYIIKFFLAFLIIIGLIIINFEKLKLLF